MFKLLLCAVHFKKNSNPEKMNDAVVLAFEGCVILSSLFVASYLIILLF